MSDRQEGSGWWLASDGNWYPPESHPSAMPDDAHAPRARYAGFWMRVWAWIIDAIIMSIGLGIVTNVLNIEGGGFWGENVSVGGTTLSLAANWLYGALMESSSSRATVGKMALSIQVTDLSGDRITFGRATGRHFAKYVSGVILLIGFMMAGWTAKKQALHDMMADTLVVRK